MAELSTWITDTDISTRFPYYTRANADEVGPEPFSPLGWSLGWAKGCVPGVADGYVAFGVLRADEFALDPPEVFGNWGGYFYNQLSLPRVMGVRMPGASPAGIDQAYFGDHPGVPPYTPHPDDDNADQSALLEAMIGWVMGAESYPEQQRCADRAAAYVADRPDLSAMSDAALVARAREAAGPMLREVWTIYCQTCLAASVGPGAVQAVCSAIERDADAVKVMTAVGGVESADASFAMWDLSRLVRASPVLTASFDAGVEGLLARLERSDDPIAVQFLSGWAELIATHGHRGPNEWDLRAHSWTTRPSLALGMIERMRLQHDSRSPAAAHQRGVDVRESTTAELLRIVEADPEAHAALQAGIASAAVFFGEREKGKNACIRLIHEGKLALMELGRRLAADGTLDDPQQLFMLLDEEIAAFLADPAAMRPTLRRRDDAFRRLRTLVPPYIVKLEDGVPPIAQWPVREPGGDEPAAVGDVLQGTPGSPGVVAGTARVVLDPSDAGAVGPGDIMIAPTTDPSWAPLFLAAEGVVVDVGAIASHAAIVCRELGIPCAVSVIGATERIPDGATIEIDGSTGSVRVRSLR